MIRYIRTTLPLILLCMAMGAMGQNMASANFETDARTAGFAGAGVGLEANAMSLFNNMAGVIFSEHELQAAYGFQSRNGKNSFHTLGGYYKLNDKHALAFGVRYFWQDKYELTNDGYTYTTFRPYDMLIDLGYARRMTDIFSLSLNLRYVSSKISNAPGIDKRGSSIAIDLGMHVRTESFSIAATVSNLGMLMDYGSDDFRMPAHLKLGGAYWWNVCKDHRITASAEGRYHFLPSHEQSFSAAAGAEYRYKGLVALRGGYHVGEKNKSAGNYATAGCGAYYKMVTVDFVYTFADDDNSMMNKVWMITAGVRF